MTVVFLLKLGGCLHQPRFSIRRGRCERHRGRAAPRLKTLKVTEPAKRGAGVKVADVAALVEKLKNEAKVI